MNTIKKLEFLRWLFKDTTKNRGTGRSTLLAKVLVEIANENKGQWVNVIDHNVLGDGSTSKHMENLINSFIDGVEMKWSKDYSKFKIIQLK